MERREIMASEKSKQDREELANMLYSLGIRTHEQFEELRKLVRFFNPNDLNNEESLALAREKFDAIAKMANA